MKVQLHIVFDVHEKEVCITKGDIIRAKVEDLESDLLQMIKACQEDFLKKLENQAVSEGFQVTHRMAPLYPVPDHP